MASIALRLKTPLLDFIETCANLELKNEIIYSNSNGVDVSKSLVRKVLKKELGYKYIKSKKLNPQANSIRVLVQRQ